MPLFAPLSPQGGNVKSGADATWLRAYTRHFTSPQRRPEFAESPPRWAHKHAFAEYRQALVRACPGTAYHGAPRVRITALHERLLRAATAGARRAITAITRLHHRA